MSFILEALKKSERERLKNKPPKFSDALMENKKPENKKHQKHQRTSKTTVQPPLTPFKLF